MLALAPDSTSTDPPGDWEWVDTAEGLARLLARVRAVPCFALDTESNSMHAYRERICLLQLSLPDLDVLVDPLEVDVRPLGELLADPSIEKVMHGADYDILCFKREYGFRFAGLFDTMLAARVLGWKGYGLGTILAERHDFRANKKMQRFDWGRRPLPEHALHYARCDTHFLLDLRAEQLDALQESERREEFEHACLRQTQVEPRPRKAELLGMWRIKGARALPPPARGVLQALYELRESLAEQLDRPVFRVMADPLLVSIARRPPRNQQELAAIRGLHPKLRGRGGARVLEAIERGLSGEPPRPPRPEPRPPREQVERFETLRTWRKAMATERGVEPDIILGKDTLLAVAEANPATIDELREGGALDDWELARYGEGMMDALQRGR